MRLTLAAVVASLIAAALTRPAAAGPITFDTALPVHADEVIVREQVVWHRMTDDPSSMDRSVNVLMVPSVLVYGVHPRVMVMGALPFLYKHMELTLPSGRTTRSTSGFGDLTGVVRVTALAFDRPHETIRLAPFVGLKLPTGADDEADARGRLPQPFQLGTGSWDPLAGIVFTWQTLRRELDVAAGYSLRTEANGFEAGDEARGDASFQYRVVPWGDLGGGVPNYLYAVLETNAVWRARDRVAGAEDPDSGGFTWYLAPGLQWVTTRVILELAVQFPVVKATNGDALRDDFVARASFRVNF